MADTTMFTRELAIMTSKDFGDGSWRIIALPSSKFAIADFKLEAGGMVQDHETATFTQEVTMTFKLIRERR